MFKWLTDLFKDNRCECRGCEITRRGWGYSPCSDKQSTTPYTMSTKQPPRKP